MGKLCIPIASFEPSNINIKGGTSPPR